MITLGSLVRSRNNSLGIGKVIDISDTQASVEYFYSIGQRIEKSLPLSSLYQLKLERQTRCYICPESQETWLIGRIYEWDEELYQYRIDLPDKKAIAVSEEQVYVRCNLPQADPIETLAMKGQETPYFHDRRFAFVKCLILQRAVSRGMTGLISANIKLYSHQVEVVRRVLEDPIQRYLLADEVGLGKTIETGAILRQYLLDEPSGRAVVLVPQYLLEQWQQELENKFYISHFLKRVAVLAIEDIHKINPKANIGLLILDEAHHIAAMATSKDATVLQRFETCKNIAHKSDRVLLLSATPVLNHEQDFLAMLHLLDPATYQLDDLAGFRERVVKRQDIGRILLSFKEGANPFVLKTNLKNLRNLFAQDEYLLELVDHLENSLQAKAGDIVEIVRAIRIHISDTYRLHRRMLRNRRASVEDVIFDRNITLRTEYDLDERSPDIHELIEEWRDVAPDDKQYHHIFLLFFRASGTWLGILKQVIQARLSSETALREGFPPQATAFPEGVLEEYTKGISTAELIQEFGADSVRILTETPKFAGEAEILQSLLQIIEQPSEDGDAFGAAFSADRLELLKTVILYQLCEPLKLQSLKSNLPKLLAEVQKRLKRPIPGDSLPKIVIFTSFVQTCAEIVRYLSDRFGEGTIVSHQVGQTPSQVEENLNRFKKDPKCFILVCDSSGEEGRNLQFANYMIYFDLPWSPNRLEQRIGRIDRIGRLLKVEFTVFAGVDLPDSLHDAWYRLLKEGFNIFRQSIASLQFYVDEKLPVLAEILFKSGANGLLESIEVIQKEIEQEQVKISEQNALDEIDALDENATQYFQALDDYDARHQEIQQVTEDWISDALRFKPITNPNLSALKRYKPTGNTLIPANDLSSNFAGVLEEFGTFNRSIANQQPGVKLYRIGEKFVDALSSYMLIIYGTKVKDVEDWKQELTRAGFKRCDLMTGKSTTQQREQLIEKWREGKIDIVVATSAFGLGIDQSDVRAVIHVCIPETIDRFYQEVGRGGRDGKACMSLTLYTYRDFDIAYSLNEKSAITVERGLQRWQSMFAKKEPLKDGKYRVPINNPPSLLEKDIDMQSDQNKAWNIRTLTLMNRANLIEIDSEEPPHKKNSESESEQAYQAAWDLYRNSRSIRIRNQLHLEKFTWESEVEPVRHQRQSWSHKNLELMKEALKAKRCISEIFAQAYSIPSRHTPETRNPVIVFRACGGCPVCRKNGVTPFPGIMPASRPVWQKPNFIQGKEIQRLLAGEKILLIFYDSLEQLNKFQRGRKLFKWLIEQGMKNIIISPEYNQFLKKSSRINNSFIFLFDSYERVLMPRIPTLIFHPPGTPLPAKYLSNYSTSSTTRIILLPINTPDPEREDRLLINIFSGRYFKFDVLCTEVSI